MLRFADDVVPRIDDDGGPFSRRKNESKSAEVAAQSILDEGKSYTEAEDGNRPIAARLVNRAQS